MKRSCILAAAALALVGSQSAMASVVKMTIATPSIHDTFTFDDAVGIPDSIPGYLTFEFITHANPFGATDGVYFGSSAWGGNFGVGYYDTPNHIHGYYNAQPVGQAFYSGSGTSIDFQPGVYDLQFGGTLTITDPNAPSGVPEPASIAMVLAGLGGIGWGWRRRA